MTFDGSAIKALLDDAVSKGAVHGIAAVVVDRSGPLFHHAASKAGQHAMFRNASMTKAVATTAALQFVEKGPLGLDAAVELILPESRNRCPSSTCLSSRHSSGSTWRCTSRWKRPYPRHGARARAV
jgi:CubicO group peptidase (beta-lactamase class C family)